MNEKSAFVPLSGTTARQSKVAPWFGRLTINGSDNRPCKQGTILLPIYTGGFFVYLKNLQTVYNPPKIALRAVFE
jgi:hypothetical protein